MTRAVDSPARRAGPSLPILTSLRTLP